MNIEPKESRQALILRLEIETAIEARKTQHQKLNKSTFAQTSYLIENLRRLMKKEINADKRYITGNRSWI